MLAYAGVSVIVQPPSPLISAPGKQLLTMPMIPKPSRGAPWAGESCRVSKPRCARQVPEGLGALCEVLLRLGLSGGAHHSAKSSPCVSVPTLGKSAHPFCAVTEQ